MARSSRGRRRGLAAVAFAPAALRLLAWAHRARLGWLISGLGLVLGLEYPASGATLQADAAVEASGGGRAAIGSYAVSDTVGQTSVGVSDSGATVVRLGLWHTLSSVPVVPTRPITVRPGHSAQVPASQLLAQVQDDDLDACAIVAVDSLSTQGGAVTFAGMTITYAAPDGFAGADSFRYTVADSGGDVSFGVVQVTVSESGSTALASGAWNDPEIWSPATVPDEGDDVTIPSGLDVVIHADTPTIGNLTLQGGTVSFAGNGVLRLNGNLTLEGAARFASDAGTVALTGSGDQTLEAAAPATLTFYNLQIDKDTATDTVTASSKLTVSGLLTVTRGKLVSASDYEDVLIEDEGHLELASDITVAGDLEIQGTGTLTTAGFRITFDGETEQEVSLAAYTSFDDVTVTAGTTLVEAISGDHFGLSGTLDNQGVIRKTQAVAELGAYSFGLAGRFNSSSLEVSVTALGGADPLTALQVERRDSNHPRPPGDDLTPLYWTLTPTGSQYTVDVTLPHGREAEAETLQVCRYDGTQWFWGHTHSTAGTVTWTGISEFSDWAVYNDPKQVTTTTIDSSLNPSTVGDVVTLTATVTPSAATGTVTFKDGPTTLGTGTLIGGQTTCSTAALAEGEHALTAEYGGDADHAPSASTSLAQRVNPRATAARLDFFRAQAVGEGEVVLTWRTLVEMHVLGFVVEGEKASGWEPLGGGLIPATGEAGGPATYAVNDRAGCERYRLVEVDLRGQKRVVAEAVVASSGTLHLIVSGEVLRIEWIGAAGASGVLETADALSGAWKELGEIRSQEPVTTLWPATDPSRFFRVRLR